MVLLLLSLLVAFQDRYFVISFSAFLLSSSGGGEAALYQQDSAACGFVVHVDFAPATTVACGLLERRYEASHCSVLSFAKCLGA